MLRKKYTTARHESLEITIERLLSPMYHLAQLCYVLALLSDSPLLPCEVVQGVVGKEVDAYI